MQIVIEALLIVPVTSLNLSVVPRSSRTNKLVFYLVVSTESIKKMYAFGLGKVGKLRAVIRLNCFGGISKEHNGTFYKIHCGIAAVFLVSINKTFP